MEDNYNNSERSFHDDIGQAVALTMIMILLVAVYALIIYILAFTIFPWLTLLGYPAYLLGYYIGRMKINYVYNNPEKFMREKKGSITQTGKTITVDVVGNNKWNVKYK